MAMSFLKALVVFSLPLAQAQQPIVRLLEQFAPGTFLENLAPRSNGRVLATELLVPNLWSFDTVGNGPPTLVNNFTEYQHLTGITQTDSDVFAVVAGNVSVTGVPAAEPPVFAIFGVDYSQCETPIIRKIADVEGAGLLNGITFLPSANALLVADSELGLVWAIDIQTGAYKVAINDTLMKLCPDPFYPLTINGLRYQVDENTLYWTNTGCGTLNKIEINADGSPAGQSAVVGNAGTAVDDFALTDDGVAYIAGGGENTVLRLTPDGAVTVIAGSLNSSEIAEPTSMQFGKTAEDIQRGTLYVTTAGGAGIPINGTTVVGAQFIAIDLNI